MNKTIAARRRQRGYAALLTSAVLVLGVVSVELTSDRHTAGVAVADDRIARAPAGFKTAPTGYAFDMAYRRQGR